MKRLGKFLKYQKVEKIYPGKYRIYTTFAENESDFDGNFENSANTHIVEVENGRIVDEGFNETFSIKESKLKHLIGTIKHEFTRIAVSTEMVEKLKHKKENDFIVDKIESYNEKKFRTYFRIYIKIKGGEEGGIRNIYIDYKWYHTGEEKIEMQVIAYMTIIKVTKDMLLNIDNIIDYILYQSSSRIKLLYMEIKPIKHKENNK